MEKQVSDADANREFSRILQDVENGDSYILTSRGKPVARIAPVSEGGRLAEEARTVLITRLQSQPVIDIGHCTSHEFYER